jgi:multisubunit Na+/H+ antiporter MnhE subunit
MNFRALDGLLDALGHCIADRLEARELEPAYALTLSQAARAAWSEPSTGVLTSNLPRGVSSQVVLRATVKHFLPGAAAVLFVPIVLLRLMDPYDWLTVAAPVGVLVAATFGFALGLASLSRWLYPHSNPDGWRGELVGLATPFVTLAIGMSLSEVIGPLPILIEYLSIFGIAVLSAMITVAAIFSPWLRPTARISRVSPPARWRAFRATVATGLVGAGIFGGARLARAAYFAATGALRPSSGPWQVLTEVTLGGFFTGFVIGIVFALALRAVYRRVSVDRLHPWRVGLWGAAAGMLPILAHIWPWVASGGQRTVDLGGAVLWIFVSWCLPMFVLAYGAVKLAKRRARTDQETCSVR